MDTSANSVCDPSYGDADDCQTSMLENREEMSNLFYIPMPPDHEYELPMFSRGPVESRPENMDIIDIDSIVGQGQDPCSDPCALYTLSNAEGEDTTMNDLFPPSLQKLLESAYSSMYEEALLEEQEVPFDPQLLQTLDNSHEELDSLDVLGEVEMTSSPAPSSPSHCTSLNSFRANLANTNKVVAGPTSSDGTEEHEECFSASTAEGEENNNRKKKKSANNSQLREFIENKCIRKRRFIDGLQTMITKIKHIRSRTGASGEFLAIFEAQEYTLENVKHVAKTRFRARKFKRKSKPKSEDMLDGDELEVDHPYAATLLTQKRSSPSVRDHQYNEAASSSGGLTKERSNMREHLYIPLQYQRDRTFDQFLKSTFARVKLLELRTGAVIEVKFHYEGCDFTKDNFYEVTRILQKKRNRRNVVGVGNVDVEHIQRSDGTLVCRIHNRPSSTAIAVSSTGGNLTQLEKDLHSIDPGYAVTSEDIGLSALSRDEGHIMHSKEPASDEIFLNDAAGSTSSRAPSLPTTVHTEERSPSPTLTKISTDYETDNQNDANSELGSLSLPMPAQTSDYNSGSLAKFGQTEGGNKFSFQSQSQAENKSAHTCQKCNSFYPPNSRRREDGFIPWIRCFDPFCQYLVHASCIGLYVMSRHDLRRLPPYYCEAHWDDM